MSVNKKRVSTYSDFESKYHKCIGLPLMPCNHNITNNYHRKNRAHQSYKFSHLLCFECRRIRWRMTITK